MDRLSKFQSLEIPEERVRKLDFLILQNEMAQGSLVMERGSSTLKKRSK